MELLEFLIRVAGAIAIIFSDICGIALREIPQSQQITRCIANAGCHAARAVRHPARDLLDTRPFAVNLEIRRQIRGKIHVKARRAASPALPRKVDVKIPVEE